MNKPMAMFSSALMLLASGASSFAETVSATYSVSVAGISVGKAVLTAEGSGKKYNIRLSGSYGFLTARGTFSAASTGSIGPKGPTPSSYRLQLKGEEDELTNVSFARGKAAKIAITPPPGEKKTLNRIPLKDEHLVNVLDPVSGILLLAIKAGQAEGAACNGSVPIFTGMVRAQITLSPARETPLQTICKIKFQPIAGHRETRNVMRIAASEELRIGFPRAADGAFRFPSSISIPLRFGTLTFERQR
jgi:hypothetical protein